MAIQTEKRGRIHLIKPQKNTRSDHSARYPDKLIIAKVKTWSKALRIELLSVIVTPVALSAVFLYYREIDINPVILILVMACAVLNYAGTMMINEYNDFKNGLNRLDRLSVTGVLVKGLLPPSTLLKAGILFYLAGGILAFPLVIIRGFMLAGFALVAFLGGYFYTAEPLGFKYMALGDVVASVFLGPLMMMGTAYAMTGEFYLFLIPASLPFALLIAAIVHANNMQYRCLFMHSWIKSIPMLLGHSGSVYLYMAETVLPFIIVLVLIMTHMFPATTLIVVFCCPSVFKAIRVIRSSKAGHSEGFERLVEMSGSIYVQFGILLAAGIFIDRVISGF